MQRIAVFVVAPAGSLVHAWSARSFVVTASPSTASVVVFEPTCDAEARALGLPRVACLPVTIDDDLPMTPDAARHVGVRADAYASEASTLLAAVSYVASESRDARAHGPLRLIWLGSLGERMPPTSPAIGAAIPIGERVQIGRSDDADIRLRQGPHSDQNTVARQHAVVERGPWGVRARDLQSTNGTYVDGQRVAEAMLHPGDELAIAWTHRLRVDGE